MSVLEPIDWFLFIGSGEPKHVSVTRIHADLCAMIGCSSNLVRMDHHYALKSTHKHSLTADHFHLLPLTLQHGRVIADRPRHLTFFYLDYITYGQWFQATIKCNKADSELWVATFHPTSDREVRRIIKKYGELP